MRRVRPVLCLLALTAPACTAVPGHNPEQTDTINVVLVTELGDIELEIYQGRAGVSAASFLKYVDRGYYEGAAFYRTVNPTNDNGSPKISVVQGGLVGDTAKSAPVAHETTRETGIRHTDGVISLARAEPGTASGAAFFICIGDQPALDFGGARTADKLGFAAFGKVIDGMDVVHAIHGLAAEGASGSAYTEGQILTDYVKIISATRIGR